MQAATQIHSHEAKTTWPLPSVDMELLSRMSSAELDALYRAAKAPTTLSELNGKPKGRMLALVSPLDRGVPFGILERFAASSAFPWDGKSFDAVPNATTGSGINRAVLLGDIFRFVTFIGPSVVDGQPALILDYDQPDNPGFIRKIHDELRQVGPQLYLGPAMWKSASGPKLVLHFAIQTGR